MSLDIFFDKAKKILDTDKDAVLARALGIAPQKLDRARNEGWIKTEVLVKLAQITGDDIEAIVLAREADKTRDSLTRETLETGVQRILSRAKQVGGILAIGAIVTGLSGLTAVKIEGNFIENSVKGITQKASQVYDFSGESSNKNYRKFAVRFAFKNLAREFLNFVGTVSRFLPSFGPRPANCWA